MVYKKIAAKNHFPVWKVVLIYYAKYAIDSVRIKNNTERTTVARCRTRSRPRAFCFPKSVSAPPEIAPERPALLPD